MCDSNPLSDLWYAFGFKENLFVVLQGFSDESVDDEWFTLGTMFSFGIHWDWLRVDWVNCLESWNRYLNSKGRAPISRYHATDCWQRNHEFKGWDIAERDRFLSELRSIIDKADGFHIVSHSGKISELADVFQIKTHKRTKSACYRLLVQYLMMQIGNDVSSRGRNDGKIVLVHDRTTHNDLAILGAFNQLKDDMTFRQRKMFTTVTSQGWDDCIPLQPADMIAYESRKQI